MSESEAPGASAPGTEKSKPTRNWRGYLKEYAIIVVGVLTALAAQQAVEWWQWQSQVKAARHALRKEMTSITDFYLLRTVMAHCLDKRLDDAGAMIAQTAAGHVPDTKDMPFNGMGRLLSDSEWHSERASQALTHFPRDELALMGQFYAQITDMRGWVYEETTAWSRLAVLLDASQTLGGDDLAQLRINHHMARRYYNTITLNARRQLDLAAKLGVRPAPLTPETTNRCNQTSVRKF